MNELDVSIIFATYKRGEILSRTLESFLSLKTESINYEIVVVDNACEIAAKTRVDSYSDKLPILYLQEPTPGKNSALITGIKVSKGNILIFTDDDIIAHPDWLYEMMAGIRRHSDCHLFGGKILPDYPKDYEKLTKNIDLTHWFIPTAFVIADWDQGEGVIQAGRIWGPNMAVKRAVFESGISFNPNIGPNGKDYVMGSETEFLKRASAVGYKPCYLPKAVVLHQIRKEQLSLGWLMGRAFRAGKGHVAIKTDRTAIRLFGFPRFLIIKYLLCSAKYFLYWFLPPKQKFGLLMERHFIRGQLCFYQKIKNDNPHV
jgi:glycosyltransferase involved in cell wall biosynthesis